MSAVSSCPRPTAVGEVLRFERQLVAETTN